jgi:hypothetical protein
MRRVLVLGGTLFAGREIALAALRSSVEVMKFNRGVSGTDVDGVNAVRGDRNELAEGSELLECPPDAGPDFGEDVENGPTKYGYQKASCENAVRAQLGATMCG